jgi:hypothetical protein
MSLWRLPVISGRVQRNIWTDVCLRHGYVVSRRIEAESLGAFLGRESFLGGVQVPKSGSLGSDAEHFAASEGFAERFAWENRRRLPSPDVAELRDFAAEMLKASKSAQ